MQVSLRQQLKESLGVTESQLSRLIQRAPYTYKTYTIPKKTGGVRAIAQPAKETKFIQHWIIENIFQKLPVHQSAMAYKIGSSIKRNAYAHKNNSYITKFDFNNFFNSIKARDIIKHVRRYYEDKYCTEDVIDIARISCIKPSAGDELCLSVGAPSSPIISNTIMFDFDCKIYNWCLDMGIIYTRYADDLTFSTNTKEISRKIEPTIIAAMQAIEYPNLNLNHEKTIHLSKKHQRRITGLIIDNNNNISIGRARKREINALIHRFSIHLLPDEEIHRLQGLLGFTKDVEPSFFSRLENKYGAETIKEILQNRKK